MEAVMKRLPGKIFSTALVKAGVVEATTERDLIRAHMHLHAVLPRLADLARLDDEARAIISEMNVAIEFFVPGGPKVVLHFKNSSVRAVRTGKADVCLMFPTCKMLNDMFDGKKVTPIPIKGVHRMGDLKKLTRLTDILTRYLKPSKSEMADKEFRAKHVELSLLVGLAATEAIATIEAKGRRVASHMPSGTMLYDVKGGPKAHVIVKDGKIEVFPGAIKDPTTTIEIRDVDLAVDLVKGEVDTFAANGSGDIKASGGLALADEYNALFDRVGLYLS
jgi:hypothetical protein